MRMSAGAANAVTARAQTAAAMATVRSGFAARWAGGALGCGAAGSSPALLQASARTRSLSSCVIGVWRVVSCSRSRSKSFRFSILSLLLPGVQKLLAQPRPAAAQPCIDGAILHIQKLFAQVVGLLAHRGLILKKGTIVDSTFIESPSSTKNKKKERDPEAHSAKKGNTWHFGYKAHIGVDHDTGLVHTVKVTAANVHDVTVTADLLTGEEDAVYGDSAYLGADKRPEAAKKNKSGRKIHYKVNRRPSQSKNLSTRSKAQIKRREHEKSSVRAKVEHVFAVVKQQLRFRKTRYRGLRRQIAKLNMLFALANLILADRPCLAA